MVEEKGDLGGEILDLAAAKLAEGLYAAGAAFGTDKELGERSMKALVDHVRTFPAELSGEFIIHLCLKWMAAQELADLRHEVAKQFAKEAFDE